MFRVWSNMGIGQLGPQLRKDTWWRATVGALAAYVLLQAMASVTALLLFIGRASNACLLGPECRLVAGWSDGLVGFVALVGGTFSVVLSIALWRLLRALWQGAFWTAYVVRGVGWATAFIGLLAVLGWGLPWLLVGAGLAWSAGRLQTTMNWPGMDGATPGPQGTDEGPVHQIHIQDDPIDRDNVVDVEFEDK